MTDQTLDGKARTRKILLAILLLAFAARVSTMLLLQTWEFPSDLAFGNEEGEIAYSLANGDGFAWPVLGRAVGPPGNTIQPEQPVPTSWKAPVNPVIVAAAFWIFGSYTVSAAVALELFQIVLSILSCYVLFRLGKLVFNSDWPGLLAALIFAFYPASIHFSSPEDRVRHPAHSARSVDPSANARTRKTDDGLSKPRARVALRTRDPGQSGHNRVLPIRFAVVPGEARNRLAISTMEISYDHGVLCSGHDPLAHPQLCRL